VRAPRAGVIGDISIRPGQLLEAGDIVLTIAGDDTRVSVLALMPGHYRPQLRPGMSLRFEVTGYRYAYQELVVESVGAQLIGPAEVQRFLGPEIADTVSVEGPVVLVEARVASPSFEVDRTRLDFHHGMSGRAEARVRSEPALFALIPGLRAIFEGGPP
jgi:membrane fusion protein (multidrug efflux system)